MTHSHQIYHHLFLPGAETPLCSAYTGRTSATLADVGCVYCLSVLRRVSENWRALSNREEQREWLAAGPHVTVNENGKRVELRARTPSILKVARKHVHAAAYVVGEDTSILIKKDGQRPRPVLLLSLQGASAKAALVLCDFAQQLRESAQQGAA